MSHVLVTGATGFLGTHIVPALLAAGHSVTAASRHPARLVDDGAQGVRLDVTDRGSFEAMPAGIDTIVHAAAERPSVDGGLSATADAIRTNTLGTLNLLEYAEARQIARVVYCSTLAIYALPQPLPIAEDGPTYPAHGLDGDYGISKLGAELLCARVHQRGRVRCLSLRLGRIYGPGERSDGLLGLWASQARRGLEIAVYGDGERSLDFIYVEDAVRSICIAVESDWEGGQLNLSSGVETAWRSLAETIADVFSPADERATVRYSPKGSRTRCYLDVSQARHKHGFVARFSLREGLEAWKRSQEAW